jgi:hypothetical protein
VSQVVTAPAQEPQSLSKKDVAQIQKTKAQQRKKDHHDPGKNDGAKQKQNAEKNQQGEARTFDDVDQLTPVARQSPGTIKIQPIKHHAPYDQNDKPADRIVQKKMRLGFGKKIRIKADDVGKPPRDTQKAEVVEHH